VFESIEAALEAKINNTFFASGLTRAFGRHTLKIGAQFHFDQVNERPNATFNGTSFELRYDGLCIAEPGSKNFATSCGHKCHQSATSTFSKLITRTTSGVSC